MKKTCIICDACGQVAVGVGYATLAGDLRRKGWTILSGHEHFCPACRVAAIAHDARAGRNAGKRGRGCASLPQN